MKSTSLTKDLPSFSAECTVINIPELIKYNAWSLADSLRIRYVTDNSLDINEMHIRMILSFQFSSITFFIAWRCLMFHLGTSASFFVGHTRRLCVIISNHLLHSLISSKNLADFFLTAEIFWYHFGTQFWSKSVFPASSTAIIQCTNNHFSPLHWYQCVLCHE